MTHDLAVVIPHYRDFRRLERCLTALEKANQLSWTDVIVVHSGDTPHAYPIEQKFPWARFIHEEVPGAGPARNAGVEATTAPSLLFIDCDCIPDQGLLVATRASLQESPVVGGRIRLFDENPGRRNGTQSYETVFAFQQKHYVKRKNFAVTANLATTRSVFNEVGPFRTNVAEDREWCQRARQKGYKIKYDKFMCVEHPTRGSWQSLSNKWLRLIHEDFASYPNSRWCRTLWMLRAFMLPPSIIKDLPKIWLSPQLNGSLERLSGSWILIRLRFWRLYQMYKSLSRSVNCEHRHLHTE